MFQIKLSDVDEVDLLDKRGYLVVSITPSGREGKIYLRKTEGIRDWYNSLQVSPDVDIQLFFIRFFFEVGSPISYLL